MTNESTDKLEIQLTNLFNAQAAAVSTEVREWDVTPIASLSEPLRPRQRPVMVTIVSLAAAIALVAGVLATIPRDVTVSVGAPPAAPPLRFSTLQVDFSADSMQISAQGQTFTAADATVEVSSDPGTRNEYTTLELEWRERNVPMRLYIYFRSDGDSWWANEIRTYNGDVSGDWNTYTGTQFRTRLGSSFEGDIELNGYGDWGGALRLSNLRLQAFVPLDACANPTSAYAIDQKFAIIRLQKEVAGFGLGTTELITTATCLPVENLHEFLYDWSIDNPAVAKLAFDENSIPAASDVDPTKHVSLVRVGPGTTTLHIVAHRKSDGQEVARADIPVDAG